MGPNSGHLEMGLRLGLCLQEINLVPSKYAWAASIFLSRQIQNTHLSEYHERSGSWKFCCHCFIQVFMIIIGDYAKSFCHDDTIKWKKFPHHWLSVQRIHRSPTWYLLCYGQHTSNATQFICGYRIVWNGTYLLSAWYVGKYAEQQEPISTPPLEILCETVKHCYILRCAQFYMLSFAYHDIICNIVIEIWI